MQISIRRFSSISCHRLCSLVDTSDKVWLLQSRHQHFL